MAKIKAYIFSLLILIVFILSLVTDWNFFLSIALSAILLVHILDKLSKGIVLREMIAFHGAFVCLIMPLLGYSMFTRYNALSRLWVRYMPVSEGVYFNFALPAMAAFAFAVCLPVNSKKHGDEGENLKDTIERIKTVLLQPEMRNKGIVIIIVGVVMLFISGFMPAAFRFVALLFYFSSFAGVLYIFYSPSFPYKVHLLVIFSVFIVANALRSGMFTVIAYMGITMFSFFFLGRRVAFWKKLLFFALGVFLLVLIQSVKPMYREFTWRQNYEGNKAMLFMELLTDKFSKGDFFTDESLFWLYYRANQGYNVALVMRRIPAIQGFDGGINLLRNATSSVVPRFLWPDKPEAGGKFNMKYYAGFTIRNWSTNIGPVGEAYGSFGVEGGIVFMFVLGLFIRWAYQRLFQVARKIPLLICWLPVLFYQVTFSMETDTLQIMNSLVKSAFFIWLLYKFTPVLFGTIRRRRAKMADNTYILPGKEVTPGN